MTAIPFNIEELENLKFDENGLIPAVVQDAATGQVLMLAYVNRQSLMRSLESGETWFYSRSRKELWHKGATSGHFQRIREVLYDCDGDTLLFKVEQEGVACHEGYRSCFFRALGRLDGEEKPGLGAVLTEIYQVVKGREAERPEGSYTTYLFNSGLDKILKKVGEEAAEVIIGAKNHSSAEVTYEMADLWYHCLVLLVEQGVDLGELATELASRRR